ncbi:hypothetical protein ACLOJK_005736 [Asimina triloba]
MGSSVDEDWDENYSVISEKPEIGFLDFEEEQSVHDSNLFEEGPVAISIPFPFVGGKPQSARIGETTVESISVRNTADEPIDLWRVNIFSSNPEGTYTLSVLEPPTATSDVERIREFFESTTLEDRVLQPGQTLKIWLSCKPKDIGLHTGIVHFDAGDEKIERIVFLLAEDKVSQSLASDKPFSRVPRKKKFACDQFVPGSRPARSTNGYKHSLPPFPIPREVRAMIEGKQVPEVLLGGLKRGNYAAFFSNLIIMEELHLEEDMRAHDMENVTMKRIGRHFLALEVPGLAEKRPSLVCGDFIFAKPVNEDFDGGSRPYQGYIHRVEADQVFLKFAKEFHNIHCDGDLYNVSFTYNRVNMRRLYQAVQVAECLGMEILFPSYCSKRRAIKIRNIVPLSQSLNEEQLSSVEMILGCKGTPPYVIHGPPGTGKTLTMVEAILQLYMTKQRARILVCAASNSAADDILKKLIDKEIGVVQENEIFRLNATTRQYEDISSDIIPFCFFEDMVFKCPPLKALMRYRIIISTYMSSSLLYAEGIPRGHFSHVFLDEAGQASEPETMVPLANICTKDTVVVLAGDPMQLGPVIFSKDADQYGLGKSYLERLFECDLYNGEDENYVTKLVRNYRCHSAILKLPSELFYKGELIACKERESSLSEWAELPNKGFPVLFVGIQGCDEREGSNPSWFNRIEASKVVDIINKLRDNMNVSENDIGVIAPYRQQVVKLKKALEFLGMEDVKVGSVEQFQGQEREVIIISTVRSTVKHNEFDRVHHLGFLSNPRRFNVAATRAKSLLVLVGNPHIITKVLYTFDLSSWPTKLGKIKGLFVPPNLLIEIDDASCFWQDLHWDKLLRYCSDNNSYTGCPLPPPENYDDADRSLGNKDASQDNSLPSFSDGPEWEDESFKVDDIPKPVTDEAEWSDGWC